MRSLLAAVRIVVLIYDVTSAVNAVDGDAVVVPTFVQAMDRLSTTSSRGGCCYGDTDMLMLLMVMLLLLLQLSHKVMSMSI